MPLILINGDSFSTIDGGIRDDISLSAVEKIAFYKIDEITSDLICCDVYTSDGLMRTIHEEVEGFNDLTRLFESLPGFDADWRLRMPRPFDEQYTVAYQRLPEPIDGQP